MKFECLHATATKAQFRIVSADALGNSRLKIQTPVPMKGEFKVFEEYTLTTIQQRIKPAKDEA